MKQGKELPPHLKQPTFLALYLPTLHLPSSSPPTSRSKQTRKDAYLLEKVEQLATRLQYFTPQVSIESELLLAGKEGSLHTISPLSIGLLLNMTGTARTHRVKNSSQHHFFEVAHRIHSRLARQAIEAQIGVAPTPSAAWALSRYGTDKISWFASIKSKKEIRERLGPFPLRALRLTEEQISLLEELGVYTLDALLSLPRKQLGVRFGVSLLKRVDQLLGNTEDPLSSFHEQAPLAQGAIFDPPLYSRIAVIKACTTLLQKLLEEVQSLHLEAERFLLSLTSKNEQGQTSIQTRELSLHCGTSDIFYIEQIITPSIEAIDFSGEVNEVKISLDKGIRRSPVQISATEPLPSLSPSKQGEFLNSLLFQKNREIKVFRVTFQESHIPEKSFFLKEISPGEVPSLNDEIGFLPHRSYPSRLLTEPKEIEALALLPDYPPARIIIERKPYKIITAFGPERISEEWWQAHYPGAVPEREYFRLLDETGRWLWVFRTQRRKSNSMRQLSSQPASTLSPQTFFWFLHGIWL